MTRFGPALKWHVNPAGSFLSAVSSATGEGDELRNGRGVQGVLHLLLEALCSSVPALLLARSCRDACPPWALMVFATRTSRVTQTQVKLSLSMLDPRLR